MNFVAGVAKLLIIAFYLIVLLFASNQHGKPWRGSVNFWVVLTVVAANFITLVFGGFFTGFSTYFLRYVTAILSRGDNVVFVCNGCDQVATTKAYVDKAFTELYSLYYQNAATADVQAGLGVTPPTHLQSPLYKGYKYPHDFENHYVAQQYLPRELAGRKYYDFGKNRQESASEQYWSAIKNEKKKL